MATQLFWRRERRSLREPLSTAFGQISERETITVELRGEDGVSGRGEAAPLEPYDGVSTDDAEAAIERYAQAVAGLDDGPEILAACQELEDLPQALAAVDVALWDRAGKRSGLPVARLLSDSPLSSVAVNATIGALDPERAGAAAARAAASGFTCVKVKVGSGDDAARLAAVRAAAGPQVAIRIDANGAWSVAEATALLPALERAAGELELVEEPVHGRQAFAALAAALPSVRAASDESGLDAAPTVCLKLSRSGGISALCAHAAYVRALGGDVFLASTFDGPVGVAAALHVAAALRVERPCGLATLSSFAEPPPATLTPVAGRMAVPSGPGLGL